MRMSCSSISKNRKIFWKKKKVTWKCVIQTLIPLSPQNPPIPIDPDLDVNLNDFNHNDVNLDDLNLYDFNFNFNDVEKSLGQNLAQQEDVN